MHDQLKVRRIFQRLIPPLSADEYKQLEENLLREGCRDPICIWNGTIIDGHNRYEICLRYNMTFRTESINLENENEVVAWICTNQLGRRNITEETRKYLIGKRYESEKIIGVLNISGKNQHSLGDEVVPEIWAQPVSRGIQKRTSQKIGDEYNLSHSTVEKYGTYSRALDALAQKNKELVPKILSGQTKVSHENVVELAKLPARELGRIGKQLIHNDRSFVGYAEMRRDLENRRRKPKASPAVSLEVSVKDMPAFDPDAEISSLTLTIPSWISSIERMQGLTNLDLVSKKAKGKLAMRLNDLKSVSDQLLSILGE